MEQFYRTFSGLVTLFFRTNGATCRHKASELLWQLRHLFAITKFGAVPKTIDFLLSEWIDVNHKALWILTHVNVAFEKEKMFQEFFLFDSVWQFSTSNFIVNSFPLFPRYKLFWNFVIFLCQNFLQFVWHSKSLQVYFRYPLEENFYIFLWGEMEMWWLFCSVSCIWDGRLFEIS